jgi:DME family drug/metabolite transporter
VTLEAARSQRVLGYLEAVAAACLWGSSGIFAVHLFRLGVPPESVALLRPVVGVFFLLAGLAFTYPGTLRIDLRGFTILCLGGGAAVGIFQVAYQMSTDAVGVPRTVALLYLAPAFVTAASGPLLREWPTIRRLTLVALTLVGVWLTVAGAEDVEATFGSRGLGWGILAGASYATYTLFGRFGSARTVFYSTLGACLLLAVVLPAASGPPVMPTGTRAWAVLVAFGALTIAAAQFLFFDALARIEASRASVAAAAEPAVAALLATLLLSQGLAPIGWVGVTMIVAGVVGVGLGARR